MKPEPPTLTDKAEPVTPYAHPATRQTVAFHDAGQAFSATGFHIGEAIEPAAQDSQKPKTKK